MATLHFPRVDPMLTTSSTVSFPVVMDGLQLPAEISVEALQDHFGATSFAGADLIAAFKEHRASIEAVARLKLPGRLNAGRGLLVSADF